MQIAIKGVYGKHKKLASGVTRTYWYHRATKVRLPDDPESDAFFAMARGLNKGGAKPKPAEGTVADLVKRYLASGLFTCKSKGTRAEYRRHCATIEASGIGPFPVEKITRPHVSAILDKHQGTPATADALRRMFSILWSYAVDELGWIAVNVLQGMKSRRAAKPADEGQRPLEEAEVEAVRKANPLGSRARLIFETMLGTALRRSDAPRVPFAAFRAATFVLLTKKTGAEVVATPTAQMREAFEAYVGAEQAAGRAFGRFVCVFQR